MGVSYNEAVAALTGPGQQFEVETVDVCGIPMRTWRNAPKSLGVMYDNVAASDRDALVYLEDRYTYARLKELSLQTAAALTAMGCHKGDRVVVAMRNLPEYVFMFWACQQIGAVLVCLNAWWTRPELEYAINHSSPKLLVVDQERYNRLHEGQPSAIGVPMVVVRHTDEKIPGALSWLDFLAKGNGVAVPRPTLEPGDPATMLFTSGTTGQPKAVLATHRNHTSAFMNAIFSGALSRYRAGAIASAAPPAAPTQPANLLPFPMFHIGGIQINYLNAVVGAKTVLMHKWSAAVAAQLIERERITMLSMAPTMLQQLLESAEFERIDRSSIQSCTAGAAQITPDLARLARERLGDKVTPGAGYGMTEATSGISSISGPAYALHPDSVGIPSPVIEVRIVDEAGHDVAPGSPGELWVKGPNIVAGYWNQPEATAQAFAEGGWLRTGDAVRQDSEGYLYIVDRLKDMIIRGGENIYCGEVENALSLHPAVSDVAVVGLPDAEMGELVVAVVVLQPGQSVDEASLIAFAKERLAYFKVPSHIVFRSEAFERTPTGKLQKFALKESIKSMINTNSMGS